MLTIEERMEVYKATIYFFEITDTEYAGFCQRLIDQAERLYPGKSRSYWPQLQEFPEVKAYEPKRHYKFDPTYWFNPGPGPGREKRIKILKKIIKDYEKQKKVDGE